MPTTIETNYDPKNPHVLPSQIITTIKDGKNTTTIVSPYEGGAVSNVNIPANSIVNGHQVPQSEGVTGGRTGGSGYDIGGPGVGGGGSHPHHTNVYIAPDLIPNPTPQPSPPQSTQISPELLKGATEFNAPQRVTRTDLVQPINVEPIEPNAYIKQGQFLNYITDTTTGKLVPVYGSPTYIEPLVNYDEKGNIRLGQRTERPATAEESKRFIESKSTETLAKPLPFYEPVTSAVQNQYYQTNQMLRDIYTQPVAELTKTELSKVGLTSDQILTVTNLASPLAVLEFQKDTSDFLHGFQKGIINDVVENPLKQVALIGLGEGLGVAYKGISTGLSAVPKVGGELTTAFKLGSVGYGLYETSIAIAPPLILASTSPNKEEAGAMLGVTAKDIALIGIGFKAGETTFNIGKGIYETRGREFIDLPQGEFPQAPISKQLDLFNKNIFKDISENPIAIHTASDNAFLKESELGLTDIPSKSELKVLYGSTKVSTPFSELPGSGAETPNSFEKFVTAFMKSLGIEANPGIATLEPLRFKEADIGFTDKPTFEGQRPIRGKYAYFKNPVEQGSMEVLRIKSEIEAGIREETGKYKEVQTTTGKKYYTKIGYVRVPIENFKYDVKNYGELLQKNLERDIDLFNKNYEKLQMYGRETRLSKGHGGEHLYNVKENVLKLIESYPELHKELIESYGSLSKAKLELEQAGLIHDILKEGSGRSGDYHGERLAKVLRSGKVNIELRESTIRAIETHEKTFGKVTAEEKILSTADRLDLERFRNKIIKEELLPLRDSIKRLNEQNEKIMKEQVKEFKPQEYSLRSLEPSRISTAISSRAEQSSVSSSISSQVKSISSSISRDISSATSQISSQVSGISRGSSGSSTNSGISSVSSVSSSVTNKSTTSSSSLIKSYNDIVNGIISSVSQTTQLKSKNLMSGRGYDVFIKAVKTNKFVRINDSPISYTKAKDVQAYYLDNSLARTTKLRKAGTLPLDQLEQSGLQFAYIPEGYYESRKYTLREFKIKQGSPFAFGEQEIKKSKYLQDTPEEKRQLQFFRNQVRKILK